MRGIRQLAPGSDLKTVVARTRTSSWNPTKGLLFGVGSLAIVLGLILGGINYWRYTKALSLKAELTVASETNFQRMLKMIDESAAEEIWDMWYAVDTAGLGNHEDSPFVVARTYAHYFHKLTIVGGSITVIGLALCLGVFLVPNRARAL